MQIRLSWRGGVGDGRPPKRKKRSLFASSFFSDLRRVRLFDLKILLFLHKGVEKRSLSTMQGMRKMKKFPLSQVQKWTQPGIVLPFFPYRENERGLVNSDLTASRRNSGGTKNLWVSPLSQPALLWLQQEPKKRRFLLLLPSLPPFFTTQDSRKKRENEKSENKFSCPVIMFEAAVRVWRCLKLTS